MIQRVRVAKRNAYGELSAVTKMTGKCTYLGAIDGGSPMSPVDTNPEYTGVLHVGRFGRVFLCYVISLIVKRNVSFFENSS